MWPINKLAPGWQRNTQIALLIGLVATALYLAVVFIERARPPAVPKQESRDLSPDYFVMPPKSMVRSLADVREFVGKPLWVREGYRWECTPGPETLGPMERLVPESVFERNKQVWLSFLRDGRRCDVAISAGDRFYLDELFLIKDPREVYKDWSPAIWKNIEDHKVQVGMTEIQITFALGYGVLQRAISRTDDANRAVDYTSGPRHFRVTYEYGISRRIQPLE